MVAEPRLPARGDDPPGAEARRPDDPPALVALVAMLFSVPLLVPYHYPPIADFHASWLALVIALLIGASRHRSFADPSPGAVRFSTGGAVLLLLIPVLLLQYFGGLLVYLQSLVLPVLALIAGHRVATTAIGAAGGGDRQSGLVPIVAWALLGSGLVQCAWAGLQLNGYQLVDATLEQVRQEGALRIGGALLQSNQMVAHLSWALLATAFLRATGRLRDAVAVAVGVLMLAIIALAGSRSAYLYLFVLGPAVAWTLRGAGCRRRWWLPALLPVAYLLIEPALRLYVVPALAELQGRTVRPAGVLDQSPRLALLFDAWQIFLAHPLLGAGWGGFMAARLGLEHPTPVELNQDDAHNLLANLAAEGGILGLLVVGVGIAVWCGRNLRAAPTPERALAWCLLGLIGLYSLVEYPLYKAFFLLPAMWLVGALETRPARWAVSRGFRRLLLALGPLVLVAAFALLPDYLRLERAYRQVIGVQDRPPGPEYLLALGRNTLFGQQADQLYLRAVELDPALLPIDLALGRRLMAARPSPFVRAQYAYRLIASGDEDEAEVLLRGVCRDVPAACAQIASELRGLALRHGGPFAAPRWERLRSAWGRG